MAVEEFPKHDGVNTLMLYSLSPETTSQFAQIKVCKNRCLGGEFMGAEGVLSKAKYLTRVAALMPALTILALYIIDFI